jgi:hypothetical protein
MPWAAQTRVSDLGGWCRRESQPLLRGPECRQQLVCRAAALSRRKPPLRPRAASAAPLPPVHEGFAPHLRPARPGGITTTFNCSSVITCAAAAVSRRICGLVPLRLSQRVGGAARGRLPQHVSSKLLLARDASARVGPLLAQKQQSHGPEGCSANVRACTTDRASLREVK